MRREISLKAKEISLTDHVLSLRIIVKVCRWPALLLMFYREPGFIFYN